MHWGETCCLDSMITERRNQLLVACSTYSVYPWVAFWNSKGKEGFFNGKTKGYLWLEFWGHGGRRGGSRGGRQECESTNELMTMLTTTESKIHDKHWPIMHVFTFIEHWALEALKLNFLSENLFAMNADPPYLSTCHMPTIHTFIKKALWWCLNKWISFTISIVN